MLTGLSGSGKSSLAFETLYAEGQRRYVESLSSYARMFLGQMEKPDVDYIEGLSPAISIDQKTTSKNPRSTVGTVTEIYDYLRLLWARVGTPHCPICLLYTSLDILVKRTENRHQQFGSLYLYCLFYGLHLAFLVLSVCRCVLWRSLVLRRRFFRNCAVIDCFNTNLLDCVYRHLQHRRAVLFRERFAVLCDRTVHTGSNLLQRTRKHLDT